MQTVAGVNFYLFKHYIKKCLIKKHNYYKVDNYLSDNDEWN